MSGGPGSAASCRCRRPGPVRFHRALLRVGGTVAGACLAILLTPWVAYDHVAGSLLVFAFATLGILGYQVSSHAFAWLFAGITVNLIVMSSLQDPTLAFHYAFYRTAEVAIGVAVALVIAFALAPDGGSRAAAAPRLAAAPGRAIGPVCCMRCVAGSR